MFPRASLLAQVSYLLAAIPPYISVLRGLILGLFSFARFYLILGLLIKDSSLGISFGAAILAAMLIQSASMVTLQRMPK